MPSLVLSIPVVAPIQLRTPQTPNFFRIFLSLVKPFPREEKLMDIPITVFLDLCGSRFST